MQMQQVLSFRKQLEKPFRPLQEHSICLASFPVPDLQSHRFGTSPLRSQGVAPPSWHLQLSAGILFSTALLCSALTGQGLCAVRVLPQHCPQG